MNFQEASALLATAIRDELRDQAFGDREVYFTIREVTIAEGYSGSAGDSLAFSSDYGNAVFNDEEASALLQMGKLGNVERNDSQQDEVLDDEEDGCPLFDNDDNDDL